MKKVIFKYPLEVLRTQIVKMPRNAKILTVQSQMDRPVIWAIVNPEEEIIPYLFLLYGTGQSCEESDNAFRNYIGTFQLWDGQEVYHVFHQIGI